MTLLYQLSAVADGILGYQTITAIPLSIIAIAVYRQLRKFRIDLVVVGLALAALPMLTPWATAIAGFKYFTMLNYGLQDNSTLKSAAVILISIYCISFYTGSFLPKLSISETTQRIIKVNLNVVFVIFCIVFILLTKYLEADTVLFTNYGSVKSHVSHYSSTVNQIFNLFAAVFLSYCIGAPRRKVIFFAYSCVIVLALLDARRTLAIGCIALLLYTFGGAKFTLKQIFGLGVAIVALWLIGIARSVGLVEYFTQAQQATSKTFFSLPGGASNIFVSTMGVVDLINSGRLHPEDAMPILSWLSGHREDTIYATYGYQYNGGMHIASVLYWNFGLIGVSLGGALMGWLTKLADNVLRRLSLDRGGTLAAMLAAGYTITLPNTMWYAPIAVIKLSIAIIFVHFVLSAGRTKGS